MNANDLSPGYKFFTTDGTDIWRLESYCTQPTCTLRKLCIPEATMSPDQICTESFGMGGVTAQKFRPIKMPLKATENKENEQ